MSSFDGGMKHLARSSTSNPKYFTFSAVDIAIGWKCWSRQVWIPLEVCKILLWHISFKFFALHEDEILFTWSTLPQMGQIYDLVVHEAIVQCLHLTVQWTSTTPKNKSIVYIQSIIYVFVWYWYLERGWWKHRLDLPIKDSTCIIFCRDHKLN